MQGKPAIRLLIHETSYPRIAECNFFVFEPRRIAYLLVLVLRDHILRATVKGGCGISRISILAALTTVLQVVMNPSLLAALNHATLVLGLVRQHFQ